MNTLEGRLRAELRAESELIRPEGIPPLSLPGRNGRRATRPLARDRRRWPGWLTPLAAAAAVLAVVAGALTVTRVTADGPPQRPAAETPYSRLPSYYAVTVIGNVVSYTSGGSQYVSQVPGRSVQIRVTATGGLAATVRPPGPYNDFAVMSGTADGRTFVLGAERYWGFRGAKSPLTGALDQAAPLRFVVLHVTPGGGVRQSGLSLPFAVRPGQQPSIALSPDGARLAVAYGGGGQTAIVRVITLATRAGPGVAVAARVMDAPDPGAGLLDRQRAHPRDPAVVRRPRSSGKDPGRRRSGRHDTGPSGRYHDNGRHHARQAADAPRSGRPVRALGGIHHPRWRRTGRDHANGSTQRAVRREVDRRVRRVLRPDRGARPHPEPVDLHQGAAAGGRPVRRARGRLVGSVREPAAGAPAARRRQPAWRPGRRPGRADGDDLLPGRPAADASLQAAVLALDGVPSHMTW